MPDEKLAATAWPEALRGREAASAGALIRDTLRAGGYVTGSGERERLSDFRSRNRHLLRDRRRKRGMARRASGTAAAPSKRSSAEHSSESSADASAATGTGNGTGNENGSGSEGNRRGPSAVEMQPRGDGTGRGRKAHGADPGGPLPPNSEGRVLRRLEAVGQESDRNERECLAWLAEHPDKNRGDFRRERAAMRNSRPNGGGDAK